MYYCTSELSNQNSSNSFSDSSSSYSDVEDVRKIEKDDGTDKLYIKSNNLKKNTDEILKISKGDWSIFFHTTYHVIVTVVGTGILALPFAIDSLTWYGGMALMLFCTLSAVYTSTILSDLLRPEIESYSCLADLIVYPKFSRWAVKPFLLLNMFGTSSVLILIAGDALNSICIGEDEDFIIDKFWWTIIAGATTFLICLVPNLHDSWIISSLGTLAAALIVGSIIAGCSIYLTGSAVDKGGMIIDIEAETTGTNIWDTFTAIGDIIYAYGFQGLLPIIYGAVVQDVKKQQSKNNEECNDMLRIKSRSITRKATYVGFIFSSFSYFTVACLGYATFDNYILPNIVDNLFYVFETPVMDVLSSFIILKTITESASYNQGLFHLTSEVLSHFNIETKKENKCMTWKEFLQRFIWVAIETLTAAYGRELFSSFTAITGALAYTPLCFIFPCWFWLRKYPNAPKWRYILHWTIICAMFTLAVIALVGGVHGVIMAII